MNPIKTEYFILWRKFIFFFNFRTRTICMNLLKRANFTIWSRGGSTTPVDASALSTQNKPFWAKKKKSKKFLSSKKFHKLTPHSLQEHNHQFTFFKKVFIFIFYSLCYWTRNNNLAMTENIWITLSNLFHFIKQYKVQICIDNWDIMYAFLLRTLNEYS